MQCSPRCAAVPCGRRFACMQELTTMSIVFSFNLLLGIFLKICKYLSFKLRLSNLVWQRATAVMVGWFACHTSKNHLNYCGSGQRVGHPWCRRRTTGFIFFRGCRAELAKYLNEGKMFEKEIIEKSWTHFVLGHTVLRINQQSYSFASSPDNWRTFWFIFRSVLEIAKTEY